MKRFWIEYTEQWNPGPMTGWPNAPADVLPPLIVPGKGFPSFLVQYGRFTFRFASLNELQTCIGTLGEKNMPTSRELSAGTGGLNKHWLSRLPASVKPWRYRSKAVEYLKLARDAFSQEVSSPTSGKNVARA